MIDLGLLGIVLAHGLIGLRRVLIDLGVDRRGMILALNVLLSFLGIGGAIAGVLIYMKFRSG